MFFIRITKEIVSGFSSFKISKYLKDCIKTVVSSGISRIVQGNTRGKFMLGMRECWCIRNEKSL